MPGTRKAIFFDRDGVLNATVQRNGKACSPRTFGDFQLNPEAAAVTSAVKRLGYLAIVVTNQPDIARRQMEPAELDRMHALLRETVPVDEIRVCPHDDADHCHCRKPLPGLLLDAAAAWDLDLAACWIVGDTAKDMGAGRAAGCRTILVDRPYNAGVAADVTARSLAEVPALLAGNSGQHL